MIRSFDKRIAGADPGILERTLDCLPDEFFSPPSD